MEGIKELFKFINDNPAGLALATWFLGTLTPSVFKWVMSFFKKEDPDLKTHAGIFHVLQTKIQLSDDEIREQIRSHEEQIHSIKNNPIMSNLEGKDEFLKYLEEHLEAYKAYLNTDGDFACLDNLIQIKVTPKESDKNFKIQNITFLYEHKTLKEKILEFLKIKEKTNIMKNLPSDFHELYRDKVFTRVDPLVIKYSIDSNFVEGYLGDDLKGIVLTDSADQEWHISKEDIEKIKERENDQYMK